MTPLDKTTEHVHIDDLKQMILDSNQFEVIRQHIFLCCKNKFSSKSKMPNSLFEKKFKYKATNRNWRTIMKLSELIAIN